MSTENLIDWFRQATPYINTHRGKTFVIMLSGDVVADEHIHNLIHDIVVLQSLGIRLVLVHGVRKQLDERLAKNGKSSDFVNGMRVTDADALDACIEVCSLVRSRLERKLSMGLPNSPMHGAKIKVASSNVASARPVGVIEGKDLMHTGVIRKIDGSALESLLALENIVLLSPIGYSPSGEAFNLPYQHLAASIANELDAEKIIAFTQLPELSDAKGEAISAMTTDEAKALLNDDKLQGNEELKLGLQHCIDTVERGTPRCHMLDYRQDGALLKELFSVDGEGWLIQSASFETIREANENDIPAIIDIIRPLERSGVLVRRDREKLEAEITAFTVIECEALIIAVAALYPAAEGNSAEIACITTHSDYQGHGRGGTLLAHLESKARLLGIEQLFVLTTQTEHWFVEQGFSRGSTEDLPASKQDLYNFQRNSKVLVKQLGR